jgi:hypothetical protein
MARVKFESTLKEVGIEIERFERKQRIAGAMIVKQEIKKRAHAIRITGNLEKGAYHHNTPNTTFVGIRNPGYHNYLVEFGHYQGKKEVKDRKWVEGHPIVYPSFEDKANEVIAEMSKQVML